MPIYGYHCDQCGHEFEILQSMKDDALKACPQCMGPLRKLLYPVGISFKGSGFYSTDYKVTPKAPVESGSGTGGEAKPVAAEGPAAGAESKAAGSESKTSTTESKTSSSESKASSSDKKAGPSENKKAAAPSGD